MKATTGFTRALPALLLALACGPDAGMIGPPARGDGPEPSLESRRYSDWSEPVNLGPVVNSSVTDFTPEISKDGLSLYFASGRPGGFPGGTFNDLWVSRRACTNMDKQECAWGDPVNLGATVNSSTNDAAPHLSRDGHSLFFQSTRPGFGSGDLYVSRRPCTDEGNPRCGWEAPVNLGPPVNTVEFEGGPSIRVAELYFNRGNTPGATPVPGSVPADIYMSEIKGDVFGAPILVTELSSPGFDQRPNIRFDGREILLSSDRAGGVGSHDIWASTRQGKGQPWAIPVNLGAPVNTEFEEQHPSLSSDGTTLFFASRRPSPGEACGLPPLPLCDLDLYVTTRRAAGEDD